MSNIPQAREELQSLAAQLAPAHRKALLAIVDRHLHREAPVRKADVTSKPLTYSVTQQIRSLAKNYPKMPLQEIGERVNVNIGRVSEVLNGKR